MVSNIVELSLMDRLSLHQRANASIHISQWLPNNQDTIPDFAGGPVVKNVSANAGDTGSVSDPGRFRTQRGNKIHAPQLLSRNSRALALQQEKPPQGEAHVLLLGAQPLLATTRESLWAATKTQSSQNNNNNKLH